MPKGFVTEIKTLFLGREVMLNLLVCIVWASSMLGYMRGIINHIPVLGDYTDQVEVMIVVLPLVLSLPILVGRLALFDYVFLAFYLMYYVLTYITHPENEIFLNKFAFECLCLALPGYIVGRLVEIDKYYNTFALLSAICVLVNVAYFAVYAQSAKNMSEVAGDDNMNAAYMALPHVVMMAWVAMRRFNIVAIVLTFMGMAFLLSCGTRGPLFCAGTFCILYFVFFMNFRYAMAIKCAVCVIMLVSILFFHEIMSFIAYWFTDMQLSTRIIEKVLSGDIGGDSGRGWLRGLVWRNVYVHGDFFGLGMLGSKVYGVIYPHQVMLDFISTFGYVLGTLLLLALFLLIGWSLWLTRGTDNQKFLLLLVTVGLLKLFLSSSFVFELFFFILVGYCVRQIFDHRQTAYIQ